MTIRPTARGFGGNKKYPLYMLGTWVTFCSLLFKTRHAALTVHNSMKPLSTTFTAVPAAPIADDATMMTVPKIAGETVVLKKGLKKKVKRRNKVVEAFFASEDNNKSEALREEIHRLAGEKKEFVIDCRRELHRIPEVMYNEHDTSHFIRKTLKQMDVPYTTGWAVNTNSDRIPGQGGYGVVVDIGTGSSPCVLLRADMDALPILEKTPGIEDFVSTREGKMHACGHDGHTAMLLGVASILSKMKDSVNGTVRLMFQPAEEGGAGAKRMVEEGVLSKDPEPQQAFALHVWPGYVLGIHQRSE